MKPETLRAASAGPIDGAPNAGHSGMPGSIGWVRSMYFARSSDAAYTGHSDEVGGEPLAGSSACEREGDTAAVQRPVMKNAAHSAHSASGDRSAASCSIGDATSTSFGALGSFPFVNPRR